MRLPVAAAGLLLALAACGNDAPANTESAYCAAASTNAETLTRPVIGSSADIDATLAVYQQMHAKAPLAIEPEWAAMEALIRAAKDLDRNDPQAAAVFAQQARETKSAADRVILYTQQKCQVLIGDTPVVSVPLVPQVSVPGESVPGGSTATG